MSPTEIVTIQKRLNHLYFSDKNTCNAGIVLKRNNKVYLQYTYTDGKSVEKLIENYTHAVGMVDGLEMSTLGGSPADFITKFK